MNPIDKHNELKNKILYGLELTYKKLIEYKKQKNTDLVVMKGNEIIRIKPK
ncbi:MAG: hypothetical protein NW207_10520 [Cytophagales bacterium]|nr:hypothetical protein [Cytophagales bacterium]